MTWKNIEAEGDIIATLVEGMEKRVVRETNMNKNSSRSHTILTAEVTLKASNSNGEIVFTTSKINFVDLAGSEKQKQTGATGESLKEASTINKSLTQLSLVIGKLSEESQGNGRTHAFIPYRNSVLTKLLKDSIGGNSRTTIICTLSGRVESYSEALSTIHFAEKAKHIKNVAKINEEMIGSTADLQMIIANSK